METVGDKGVVGEGTTSKEPSWLFWLFAVRYPPEVEFVVAEDDEVVEEYTLARDPGPFDSDEQADVDKDVVGMLG